MKRTQKSILLLILTVISAHHASAGYFTRQLIAESRENKKKAQEIAQYREQMRSKQEAMELEASRKKINELDRLAKENDKKIEKDLVDVAMHKEVVARRLMIYLLGKDELTENEVMRLDALIKHDQELEKELADLKSVLFVHQKSRARGNPFNNDQQKRYIFLGVRDKKFKALGIGSSE